MKNKKNSMHIIVYPVSLVLLISLAFTSCTIEEKPGGTDEEYIHSPPSSVCAEKRDGLVMISWEAVPGSEGYQLFLETRSGEPVKMADGFTGGNSYTYKEYNYSDTITYKVRCWTGGDYSSDMSRCSNWIHQTKPEVMKALKPVAESFSVPGRIIVRWEAHPYATDYLLYRYTGPECDQGTLVYEGEELSYTDTDVIMGNFYYYKVVNADQWKTYDPSPAAFGVSADSGKDDYEDNETREQATILEHNSINKGTIYYFKDSAGNSLVDEDWYYVQVPAYTEIPIIIEDFTHALEDDDLYITIGAGEKQLLKEGNGYRLYNPSGQTSNMVFSITINPHNFYNEFGGYSIIVEE
jgi:hypothetical protein